MGTSLVHAVLDAVRIGSGWEFRTREIAAEHLGVPVAAVSEAEILSASVDSRRGAPKILLTLRVEAAGAPASPPEAFAGFVPEVPRLAPRFASLRHPLVVGTGPAGIYAALLLAESGCEPIILDRGAPVEERTADCEKFLRTRTLDPASNLLVGEGGAGTFSDGKLHTGIKDRRAGWVKRIMAECGAPDEIRWQSRAHAGSDSLRRVAANLRRRIEALGGRFLFHTEVTDVAVRSGVCAGVVTASGETITAPLTLIAPGLGGRELVRNLTRRAAWEPKPFQIGCRIEHPQEFIDLRMYRMPRPAALGAAEYHLVSRKASRHVASFCMCPGGEVVNATAWEHHSATNGMSLFARAGKFANSCLIATFAPDELGGPEETRERTAALERACFTAGGGDYTLPAQDAAAFLRRQDGLSDRTGSPAVGIRPGRIDELIPPELFDALSAALRDFDARIPGFIRRGRFIGVESCVSSPIRFLRDPVTGASSLPRLYLAGEGCGAAGGIISAACHSLLLFTE